MTAASPAYFVLAYPALDTAALARIEAFRRRHEPLRADLVRAHVTLVFGVQRIAPHALVRHVADLAAATAPFGVTFDRVEAHAGAAPADRHLFLMIRDGAFRLEGLHRALYAGPLDAERRTDLPFVPHMTIASPVGESGLAAAQREAASLGLPLSGHVDALHVASLGDGRLEPIATLPFRPLRSGAPA